MFYTCNSFAWMKFYNVSVVLYYLKQEDCNICFHFLAQELLGRPIILKVGEKSIDRSVSKEEHTPDGQPEES